MKVTAALFMLAGAGFAAPVPEPVAEPLPMPTPPGIPTAATAKTQLAALTVRAWTNTDTYDRDLFPHWSTVSGTCNTRETVLQRDGTNVVVSSACAATSGTWKSPYDGASWTAASDVDIDHMVPLKNAWISGAASWTTAKREQFANDLTRPQLWAVTDEVNQSKSDKSPDSWKPPLTSFYCIYARSWVQVKSYWALSVTSAEKTALTSMLNTC
ncbi:secreted protein [Colletotrichum tofieldiae]|uniref:Secreted protein n=1 Tax=Colletotrichum tofieldiae TaxID=708197 RepID=A0A161VNY7_9PEZI|nr:secreted protein [Colletotrichum tofieldiae]GKT55862.1 secreted protein [Colletotrichum tofieldiae]GKT79300.1 secreted protein [Colletotrichum tofieldiae]GKT82469.1 secreted protein [Colletotrichum tofieldiae]